MADADGFNIHIPFNVYSASAITCAKNYVSLTEAQLSQAYTDERFSALEQYRRLPDADEADYEVYVRTVERMFEEDFRPILRFTTVVYLYLIFETYVSRHIAEIQRLRTAESNILKRLKKNHGLVEATQIYFKDEADLSFFTDSQWQQLREIEQVRNCIVHAAGIARDSRHPELIYDLERRLVGLEIDRYGGKDVGAPMTLHQPFSEYCISVMENFFNALGEAAERAFHSKT
jgi:hypothetical protein